MAPITTCDLNGTVAPAIRRPEREMPGPGSSGQVFLLDDIDWETYVAISDALMDRPMRLTYDRGRLELMTLSRPHERNKTLLSRLIDVLTEEFDLPNQGAGSMTCRRKGLKRALEPDDSWYIASLPAVIDKEDVDLEVDPPPDLAVEVDESRSSVNRMGIYQALRVPEIWRFDGKRLIIYVLAANGEYKIVNESPTFPGIPIAGIVQFLLDGINTDHNAVRKAFRQWVRRQLRKRKKTK